MHVGQHVPVDANAPTAVVMVAPTDPRPWYIKPPADLGVVLGPILALAVAAIAWRQWRHDQIWRKDEAKSRQRQDFDRRVEDFYTPSTKAALAMMFRYDTMVKLTEWRKWERVTWPEVELALVPSSHRLYLFEDKIGQIRDCFFDFLESIGRLAYLLERNLIASADVDHIVRPLAERISNQEDSLFRNLRIYIQFSQMNRVVALFAHFGHSLCIRLPADLASMEDDLIAGKYGAFQPCPWGPEMFKKSAISAAQRATP